MAERKFDYENVATVYKNMQNITGDASNEDSIAGILHKINEEVHDSVNVCDEAVFGNLGKQLLLDWDNTSSNFDSFVESFNNWAALIAQSSGNYAEFEKKVAGLTKANPLGLTSNGKKKNYIEKSPYTDYTKENLESTSKELSPYSGSVYYETNSIEKEQERLKNDKSAFAWNAVGTGLTFFGLKGMAKAGKVATNATTALSTSTASNVANSSSSILGKAKSLASAAKSKITTGASKVANKAVSKAFNLSDEALEEIARRGTTPSKVVKDALKKKFGKTTSTINSATNATQAVGGVPATTTTSLVPVTGQTISDTQLAQQTIQDGLNVVKKDIRLDQIKTATGATMTGVGDKYKDKTSTSEITYTFSPYVNQLNEESLDSNQSSDIKLEEDDISVRNIFQTDQQ